MKESFLHYAYREKRSYYELLSVVFGREKLFANKKLILLYYGFIEKSQNIFMEKCFYTFCDKEIVFKEKYRNIMCAVKEVKRVDDLH